MAAVVNLRAARNDDGRALTALMRDCWLEYPGVVFAPELELPELKAIADYFAAQHGRLWVAETAADHRLAGSIGILPTPVAGQWELVKLYVARERRRDGVGTRLAGHAEAAARAAGATTMILWSDSRFETAHRFYAARGYRRQARSRRLQDLSASTEYGFRKLLAVA